MYEYRASVKKIVDADTLDLVIDLGFHIFVTKRVRLIGLDAPEKFTEQGKIAKQFVENAAPVNSSVIIQTKIDSLDKYGRILAEIFLDNNKSLNKMLLNNGLANLYQD